jgi:hypothetical protein
MLLVFEREGAAVTPTPAPKRLDRHTVPVCPVIMVPFVVVRWNPNLPGSSMLLL